MTKMHIGLYVKYRLLFSYFKETSIFLKGFRETLNYQISWKSVQWEPSCSTRTNEKTDMTKLSVVFRKFAKAPKNPASVST